MTQTGPIRIFTGLFRCAALSLGSLHWTVSWRQVGATFSTKKRKSISSTEHKANTQRYAESSERDRENKNMKEDKQRNLFRT